MSIAWSEGNVEEMGDISIDYARFAEEVLLDQGLVVHHLPRLSRSRRIAVAYR